MKFRLPAFSEYQRTVTATWSIEASRHGRRFQAIKISPRGVDGTFSLLGCSSSVADCISSLALLPGTFSAICCPPERNGRLEAWGAISGITYDFVSLKVRRQDSTTRCRSSRILEFFSFSHR